MYAMLFFLIRLGNQDKCWAPNKVCLMCIEGLRLWRNSQKNSMPFVVPVVWRRPQNYFNYCYFCMIHIKDYNSKSRKRYFIYEYSFAKYTSCSQWKITNSHSAYKSWISQKSLKAVKKMKPVLIWMNLKKAFRQKWFSRSKDKHWNITN